MITAVVMSRPTAGQNVAELSRAKRLMQEVQLTDVSDNSLTKR